MKKWKQVSKVFKKEKLIKEYKSRFKYNQLRFAFSKIAFAYSEKVDYKELVKIEKEILKMNKTEVSFSNIYKKMHLLLDNDWKWEEFGKFMFFIYQTSLYWKDKRKKNIFNKENFIEKNEMKRKHFNNWLSSIPIDLDNFNKKLILVMECVF